MLKKTLLVILATMVALVLMLLYNALNYPSQQPPLASTPERLELTAEQQRAATEHLQAAIRIPTVSQPRPLGEAAPEFDAFRALLHARYPQVFEQLELTRIQKDSLLLTWPGTAPEKPAGLVMAHMDVVPADTSSPENWPHAPFSGDLADGYIWGRGAMDVKASLIALLEAVNLLLTQGFSPTQTLYLAFGHDEELGGMAGNRQIANHLKAQNVRLAWVLDEGFFVLNNMVPGVSAPVAMIGIAEKGYLNLKLNLERPGGHSSTPPTHTAIGEMSQAIHQLETQPMPGGLSGLAGTTFDWLGPELPFLPRLLFANQWLFAPVIETALSRGPATNALMRTTSAVTLIDGGTKENVLPNQVQAVVNFRISPTDSIDSVKAHVRRVLPNDDIHISQYGLTSSEPSPVSSTESPFFLTLGTLARTHFPGAIIAPATVVGATDSRHYADIADNIYRFQPIQLDKPDVKRIHGHGERIAESDYHRMIEFYAHLLSLSLTDSRSGNPTP